MKNARGRPRRYRVLFWLSGGVVVALAVLAALVLTVPSVRVSAKRTVQSIGLGQQWNALSAALTPAMVVEMLPADRVTTRRLTVNALHAALRRRDFESAALLNSILSQEAFVRAHRTLKFWERQRDVETGLVPRGMNFREAFWNSKDTAADLFPYLLITSQYIDHDNEKLWRATLAKERELCGALPCTVYLQPTNVVRESETETVFGASEYAKDGLLAIAERAGRGPWFERLEEIATALIGRAGVATTRGNIPSADTEVNGNMLQVLVRLYWATGHDEYLEMAERIADVYVLDILPNNGFLPSSEWDFSQGAPASQYVSLRDHGSEVIPGLAEIYFLEQSKHRPRAPLYRSTLRRFYDEMLRVGRSDDGLWFNAVDLDTHRPLDRGVVDTWGYILNALHTFDRAEADSTYAEEIRRTMRAAAARKSFRWEEPMAQDGHADAIESMLYLLPWFGDPECAFWVDDEMEVLFHMQSEGGAVTGGYLDGNFNRTTLLYAGYKTLGITARPWRDDVYVGAAYDQQHKRAYVHLNVSSKWAGVLKFDYPRHRKIWNLPVEYPRLNGTPEWFVVDPEKTYRVTDLKTGKDSLRSGHALIEGLEIHLTADQPGVSLRISDDAQAGSLTDDGCASSADGEAGSRSHCHH